MQNYGAKILQTHKILPTVPESDFQQFILFYCQSGFINQQTETCKPSQWCWFYPGFDRFFQVFQTARVFSQVCLSPPSNESWYGNYSIGFLKSIFLTYWIIPRKVPHNIAVVLNWTSLHPIPECFFSCSSSKNLSNEHNFKMAERTNEHAMI